MTSLLKRLRGEKKMASQRTIYYVGKGGCPRCGPDNNVALYHDPLQPITACMACGKFVAGVHIIAAPPGPQFEGLALPDEVYDRGFAKRQSALPSPIVPVADKAKETDK